MGWAVPTLLVLPTERVGGARGRDASLSRVRTRGF